MVQERPKLIFSVKLFFSDLHLSTRSLYASQYQKFARQNWQTAIAQLHFDDFFFRYQGQKNSNFLPVLVMVQTPAALGLRTYY